MIFKLAWRNIWRNKRRTFITAASIFFAVLFSVFMNSIQKGAWVRMLDNIVNFYYGYGQIHKNGYWEDQNINEVFELTPEITSLPENIDGLSGVVPRLESFALGSYGTQTNGLLVVGVDPTIENGMTKLKDRMIEGEYLESDDKDVIIAEGLASLLSIKTGDTIVLISQGYHGLNAAGKYPVKGLLKFTSPDLNKRMLYMPLKECQYFFGADNLLTSIALKIDDSRDVEKVLKKVSDKLDREKYEVLGWKEMIPELVEAQKTDAAGNYIFLLVLYAIIGFGIFGTILMMVKERAYEFGVLVSVGMSRAKLAFMVWLETIILGLFGAMCGIVAAIPLVYYFKVNPIDFGGMSEEMGAAYEKWGFDPVLPTIMEFQLFFWQAFIVFVITSILATYAIWKVYRLKPVESMKE